MSNVTDFIVVNIQEPENYKYLVSLSGKEILESEQPTDAAVYTEKVVAEQIAQQAFETDKCLRIVLPAGHIEEAVKHLIENRLNKKL